MSDYIVSVKRTQNCLSQWEWRILQRSKDFGVGLYGVGTGFSTEGAARSNGEVALQKVLAGVGQGDVGRLARPNIVVWGGA